MYRFVNLVEFNDKQHLVTSQDGVLRVRYEIPTDYGRGSFYEKLFDAPDKLI